MKKKLLLFIMSFAFILSFASNTLAAEFNVTPIVNSKSVVDSIESAEMVWKTVTHFSSYRLPSDIIYVDDMDPNGTMHYNVMLKYAGINGSGYYGYVGGYEYLKW